MSFTPAHLAQARGPSTRSVHPKDLIRVRTLYVEKRFKHCIAACEELLEQLPPTPITPITPIFAANARPAELHPVHRAFLIFHQAISYECMGLAAHKYSQNKLRFLGSTQQNFQAALDVLPQPFANTEGGQPFSHQASPDLPNANDDVSYYEDDSSSVSTPTVNEVGGIVLYDIAPSTPIRKEESVDITQSVCNTPVMVGPQRIRSTSDTSAVSDRTESNVSQALTVPNFDDYSSRQDLVDQDVATAPNHTPEIPVSKGLPRSTPLLQFDPDDFDSSDEEDESREHSTLLPRSMRSLNLAAYDVSSEDSESPVATPTKVPVSNIDGMNEDGIAMPPETPLTKAMTGLSVPATTSASHTNRLSASLSSTHVLCEELVPTPLFKIGKKTAKVSLDDAVQPVRPLPRIPRPFHNNLSLLPARKTAVQTLISKFEGTIPSPASSYTTATPLASAGSQITLYTPITPRFQMIHNAFDPYPQQSHLEAYLTSRSLANYNAQLTAFRTCLITASDQVAEWLKTAEHIQQQHEEEKRSVALQASSEGLPTNRLASMWLLSTPAKPKSIKSRGGKASVLQIGPSPSRARMLGRSESLRSRKKLPLRNRVEESDEKRAERIEKLRKNGFRVNKETCGWKGEEYYETFRRQVEMELSR
jgi:hypothetical protein